MIILDLYNSVIIGISIVALIIITRILNIPFRKIIKLIINSIMGAIIILAINKTSTILGIHIGLNIITSVFIGIFGIPGAILLIAINFF